MKHKYSLTGSAAVLLALVIAIFGTQIAFAVDADGDGYDDDTGEPVIIDIIDDTLPVTDEPFIEDTTEYIEPETELVTEEITEEPELVTEEPETEPETEEPAEAPTEALTEVEAQTEYIWPVQDETEFIAPTVAKTVSEKKYTTNYTAGIISWICVGVGVVVAAAALISTKAGGRRGHRR